MSRKLAEKRHFLAKSESSALTFLLISHHHLSPLKLLLHRGFADTGESVRDEMQKIFFWGKRIQQLEQSRFSLLFLF